MLIFNCRLPEGNDEQLMNLSYFPVDSRITNAVHKKNMALTSLYSKRKQEKHIHEAKLSDLCILLTANVKTETRGGMANGKQV